MFIKSNQLKDVHACTSKYIMVCILLFVLRVLCEPYYLLTIISSVDAFLLSISISLISLCFVTRSHHKQEATFMWHIVMLESAGLW